MNSREILFTLSTNVKKLRKAHNLSVRELGALADVSYTVIYDLEEMRNIPKVETTIKLAEAFNTTYENLINMENCEINMDITKALLLYGIKESDMKSALNYLEFLRSKNP